MIRLLKSLVSDTNPLRLWYHRIKSERAAKAAGYPARKLAVIGITGTDGKTTTVAMVAHILQASGKSVGAASTAFLSVNGKREQNPTQKTSMSAGNMQAFLKRLVAEGCEIAVLEVSSHGLIQSRFAGITFDIAAITNIAAEHLDYHGTMDEYMRAKGLLFQSLRSGGAKVLNADDQTYKKYKDIASAKTFTYSPSHDLSAVHADPKSVSARTEIDGKAYDLALPVAGEFNLWNALCAIRCAQAMGVSADDAIAALKSFVPPSGRMERIDEGQSFSVFVDFTVTPQAFERTLTTIRKMIAPGKRVLVLTGSCGNRMKEKRPVIGRLCSQLADTVVLTDDEPYTEDPQAIIDEIWTGIDPGHADTHRILDRREAIRFVLSHAKEGDAVVLCGMGSYPTRMMKDGPMAWNEQAIVREELKNLTKK